MDGMGFGPNFGSVGMDDQTFTWEMIGLGLEEPLPPQDTIDELYVTAVPNFFRQNTNFSPDNRYTSKRFIHLYP